MRPGKIIMHLVSRSFGVPLLLGLGLLIPAGWGKRFPGPWERGIAF